MECKRAAWPRDLETDSAVLPEFIDFLSKSMCKKKGRASELAAGARRVLGVFAVEHDVDISSTAVLALLYMETLHQRLFSLPLFSFRYGWSGRCIDGFLLYAQ